MSKATISVVDSRALLTLFGPSDRYLRKIRETLDVDISARNDRIHIEGDEASVARATDLLVELKTLAHHRGVVEDEDVAHLLEKAQGGDAVPELPAVDVLDSTRSVRPRTAGQARYVDAIRHCDVVFCVGPAGTGKTYLAVAMAIAALKHGYIRKIVLVRPAVEAGESLGFLPGDLHAKIHPYLRPLLDALREVMDFEQVQRYTEQDVIEVIPLAYMRGRTLNEAFIILDEAQNTTVAQMKMFLTRMGHRSKIVVSGDKTQIDLPHHARSGLVDGMRRLRGIGGIMHIEMSKADIVRHRLVQEIVRAYEEEPKRRR